MFTRSHLEEMKRRYASMYASPVDNEVIEDGTIEGVNQYKKDTPGQGIEEDEIEEGLGLQLKMAFDDAKIKTKPRKGKIVIAKKDKKKAMDVLSKTLPSKLKKYVDKAVDNFLVFEEVKLNEGGDQIWFKGIGMTFDEFSLIFATMYVPGSRVLPTEVAPDNSKYGSLLKKLSRKDQKWVVSLLKDYMKRGGVVHKDVVKNFVLKEVVEIDETPKGTPKPKVEKSNSGFQVMVWSPKGKKYIPQGQPHKNEKDAEKDAKSFEEVEIDARTKGYKDTISRILGKKIKEEVELDEAAPMYPPTIKNLRMIVKDKQNQVFMFKVGKARVDLFTASAIIAVYDGLKKPEHKKKLEDMIKTKEGFLKTQAFAMKMVK